MFDAWKKLKKIQTIFSQMVVENGDESPWDRIHKKTTKSTKKQIQYTWNISHTIHVCYLYVHLP